MSVKGELTDHSCFMLSTFLNYVTFYVFFLGLALQTWQKGRSDTIWLVLVHGNVFRSCNYPVVMQTQNFERELRERSNCHKNEKGFF